MPCTLVRLVQFSKVFVTCFSQATTILVYHSRFRLSTLFLKTFFLNFFQSVFSSATYHSPYGIRTRVTAVKRRCLNPLTNGPELLFLTLTIIPTFFKLCLTPFFKLFMFFFFFCIASYRVRISNSLNTIRKSLNTLCRPRNRSCLKTRSNSSCFSLFCLLL